jgi:hypothetical protein
LKTQTVQIVSKNEVIAHLTELVESKHATTQAGRKYGGIRATARDLGIPEAEVANVMRGLRAPSSNILSAFGLVKRDFYVPLEKTQRK